MNPALLPAHSIAGWRSEEGGGEVHSRWTPRSRCETQKEKKSKTEGRHAHTVIVMQYPKAYHEVSSAVDS